MCEGGAGISITQWAILRFSVPHGWHVTPTELKFGVDLHVKIHPIPSVKGWGVEPQNWKYYAISEYERRAGPYLLDDFYEIFSVCGKLHAGSSVVIWVDSLKRLQSYGV